VRFVLGRPESVWYRSRFRLLIRSQRSEAHHVKELVEAIAKALVDNPDHVQVRAIEGEQVTVFELRVHKSDLGQVIGREGRTAKAIRTIIAGVGMKVRKRFTLEILE
jgi:predicted RNA-binding protein YlqC (UPF0109 family)